MSNIALLLAFVTALSLLFLVIYGVVYLTRRTYDGFLEWTLAMGAYALGGLTFALAPRGAVVIFVANLFTLTGTLLLRRGLIRFRGGQPRRAFELGLLLLYLPVFGWFALDPANATPRIVVYSALAALLWGSATWVTLSRRPPHFGSADRLLACLLGAQTLLSMARGLHALLSGDTLPPLQQGEFYNVVNTFLQVLVFAPMALALLGLNAQRVEHDLRSARHELEADLAERARSAARLQESEQRLQRAQEGGGVGVWELDLRTGQSYQSPECRRLNGLPLDGPVNDAMWRDRVLPGDLARIDAEGAAAMAARRPFEVEFRIRLPSGDERWLLSKGDVLRDERDRPVRLVGINLDITARKQAELQVRELNEALEQRVRERTAELESANHALVAARDASDAANRAKSAFLANMSHELRTPLSAVIGMVYLLRGQLSDEGARDRLGKIDQAARHLLALIGDILDLSRIEAGRLELADAPMRLAEVRDKVLSVMSAAAEQRGLALSFELPEALAQQPLRGDALRLSQILLNLTGNAIKFTAHGSVRVRCEALGDTADAADAVTLRFAVSDTGEGISPEDQQRLFTAFEQVDNSPSRRHGGSGLGLSISRRLAEKMDGRIGVDSTPGQGSTFWFTVRLRHDTPVAAPVPVMPPSAGPA